MEGIGDQKMFLCRHIERGINLERLSQLSKVKLTQCESCPGKGRSSQKKAARLTSPAQQSCQQEEKWVCLGCGYVACDALLNRESVNVEEENGKLGGEKKDENKAPAKGHAWGHFVLSRHPLAMQIGDNCVYWCFMCNMPVDYPVPLVDSPNDSQVVNWRNPLQDAADVVRGKTSKKKSLFKDPAKAMEPVRCMIDTVKSVIDSATHLKAIDAGKLSLSAVSSQNPGLGRKRLVKGLINLGNTCFFNSILQNLLALDVLRSHFTQEPPDSEGPLTSSLRSLFQEMNSEPVPITSSSTFGYDLGMKKGWRGPGMWGSDGKVLNPSSLFDAICAKAPRFRGFQQQDCHELLRYLLEGLNLEERGAAMALPLGECKKVISTSLSKVLGQNGHSMESESAEEDKDSGKANKPSQAIPTFVESVFGGQLSSTVLCHECGHVSVVYETMLDLSLQIPARQNSRKRQACDEQGTLDLLDGRSHELLEENSRHIEQVEMLETQEALIASTLIPRGRKECTSDSCRSAHTDQFNSVLARRAEPPQVGPFASCPSKRSGLMNSDGTFAEGSVQNVPNFAEKLENTLSVDIGEADLNLSTHQQGMDLNESRVDACVRMDNVLGTGVSSEFLQKHKVQGDSSISCNHELQKGGDLLTPSAPGIFFLPCESSEGASKDKAEQSTWFEHAGTRCSFDKQLLKEKKDLPSLVEETTEHDESSSLHLESVETVCGRCQEMQALKGHPKGDQVIEMSDVTKFCGDANCGVSDKIKAASESEQLADSEDTSSPLSLEACLADFIKPELLCGENAWECEKCSRLVNGMPDSRSLHSKSKMGEGHVSNEVIKHLGDDLAHPRDGKAALLDAEALSGVSTMTFEVGTSLSATGNHKVEQTQYTCATMATLGDKWSTFELEEVDKSISLMSVNVCKGNHKSEIDGVNDHDRTGDSQSLSMEKSVISHPLLNKPEQPEGNGVGYTYSKILPNLKREKLSFFSNLFFKTENHKVKTDSQQKLVKRQAVKKYLICKVPFVLTVHLKRFAQDVRGRLNKLSGHVAFSEYLNLQSFLDSRCPDYDDCIYRLVGIVEHSGTMRGGHYVAYVRGPGEEANDSWCHISDSVVCRCTLQDVLNREAYLLFYERHSRGKGG